MLTHDALLHHFRKAGDVPQRDRRLRALISYVLLVRQTVVSEIIFPINFSSLNTSTPTSILVLLVRFLPEKYLQALAIVSAGSKGESSLLQLHKGMRQVSGCRGIIPTTLHNHYIIYDTPHCLWNLWYLLEDLYPTDPLSMWSCSFSRQPSVGSPLALSLHTGPQESIHSHPVSCFSPGQTGLHLIGTPVATHIHTQMQSCCLLPHKQTDVHTTYNVQATPWLQRTQHNNLQESI